ncbi:MAG: HD domain-containing protein [Gemmatimonadales bacterium]|nr:HD domain-containing protein [Gemmatimonadales bacterium]
MTPRPMTQPAGREDLRLSLLSRRSPGASARRGRSVLLVGDLPEPGQLTIGLTRHGLLAATLADRDDLIHTIGEYWVGAILLGRSFDLTADTTLILRALESDPRIALVVVGEGQDARDVAHFSRHGVSACLERNAGSAAIFAAVDEALQKRERRIEDERREASLRASLQDVTLQLHQEAQSVRKRMLASLEALVRLSEACHSYLTGHAVRVADLAAAVAVAVGEDDASVEAIRLAGRLHDLGMIGVPAEIVDKPGALTDSEFEQVKRHPQIASDILAAYPDLAEITRAIRGHHERWDGTGYPDGLVGESIPRMARILAAAEVWDALVSPRPYRQSDTPIDALERIRQLSGRALDPAVCQALAAVIEGRKTLSFVDPDARASGELPEAVGLARVRAA